MGADGHYGALQAVELGGLPGIFLRLDPARLGDLGPGLDQYLAGLGPELRLLARRGPTTQYAEVGRDGRRARRTQCRYCDHVFHCRPDLAGHQARQHPGLPPRPGRRARRPCPQCDKMVLNLALHVRNKHQTDSVNTAEGLAQCRLCSESYPVGADHESVCRLSPVCPVCLKSFSQWRVMNKHRRIVHMGLKIACPHCDKDYHDSQSLKKHVDAVHLKIKKICPLCGVSVTALSVHMNSVHTGVKNFPCSDCEKKFKSNYDLTRHRATVHLGQKPACPYCGKRLANMRQHIRVVHKQIRFPCDICKKQLTTRSELKKHTASAHYPAEQGAAGGALEYQCEDQMIQQYLGRHQFGLEGLAWPDSGASSPIHPSIHP